MSSGAITAWQQGSTGQGVKIAIVDSGINPALAEFSGRIDPASRDVAGRGRPLTFLELVGGSGAEIQQDRWRDGVPLGSEGGCRELDNNAVAALHGAQVFDGEGDIGQRGEGVADVATVG